MKLSTSENDLNVKPLNDERVIHHSNSQNFNKDDISNFRCLSAPDTVIDDMNNEDDISYIENTIFLGESEKHVVDIKQDLMSAMDMNYITFLIDDDSLIFNCKSEIESSKVYFDVEIFPLTQKSLGNGIKMILTDGSEDKFKQIFKILYDDVRF